MTQEQRAYILAHLNDRPRTAVAKAAGVSASTLYRVVRHAGGELDRKRSTRDPHIVDTVRQYYPTMTATEIAQRFGYLKGRINKVARELGITHNADTLARIAMLQSEGLRKPRTPEVEARKVKRWQLTRRMDLGRVLRGAPQITAFRFSQTTRRAYKAKWHLCHRYAYIESDHPYTLLYDQHTHRINEAYYEQKYGLSFVQEEGE